MHEGHQESSDLKEKTKQLTIETEEIDGAQGDSQTVGYIIEVITELKAQKLCWNQQHSAATHILPKTSTQDSRLDQITHTLSSKLSSNSSRIAAHNKTTQKIQICITSKKLARSQAHTVHDQSSQLRATTANNRALPNSKLMMLHCNFIHPASSRLQTCTETSSLKRGFQSRYPHSKLNSKSPMIWKILAVARDQILRVISCWYVSCDDQQRALRDSEATTFCEQEPTVGFVSVFLSRFLIRFIGTPFVVIIAQNIKRVIPVCLYTHQWPPFVADSVELCLSSLAPSFGCSLRLLSRIPGFTTGHGFNPSGGAQEVVRVSQLCIVYALVSLRVGCPG
ncbi:hypothetical protein F511_35742 [Dorcoceras hygrometricum]|uniref:Uncharacterized protein n=1 Tax=Dorcoceras hygrometricum TaxID=472368 RepID=A0A2Z7C5J8_9LAMI|nr:hypothetical protein F511_35742 [Dorcoceras hygrometricum]